MYIGMEVTTYLNVERGGEKIERSSNLSQEICTVPMRRDING